MSTVIPLPPGEGKGWRIFTKGASEIIMSKCSFMLGDGGRLDKFTKQARDRCVRDVIEPMARDGLRTISIAYRDFVLGKAEPNQVHLWFGQYLLFPVDFVDSGRLCQFRSILVDFVFSVQCLLLVNTDDSR